MLREAEFDIYGPLVYKKRYGKSHFTRAGKESLAQKEDQQIMVRMAATVFGITAIKGFGFEWHDRIPDYLDENLTQEGKPRLAEVFFDHYIFIEWKGKTYPIVGETDDESHRSPGYCMVQGWDFNKVLYKDKRKNIWCERSNTLIFRVPDYLTTHQKEQLLYEFFTNAKQEIENCP